MSETYNFVLLREDGSGRALRLLSFDHDPDLKINDAEKAIALSPEAYEDWKLNFHTRAMIDGAMVTVPSDLRYEVSSFLVVERLAAAGLLRAAMTALKIGRPIEDLTDAELTTRTRWEKSTSINNGDQAVISLLRSIGADPAVILAAP